MNTELAELRTDGECPQIDVSFSRFAPQQSSRHSCRGLPCCSEWGTFSFMHTCIPYCVCSWSLGKSLGSGSLDLPVLICQIKTRIGRKLGEMGSMCPHWEGQIKAVDIPDLSGGRIRTGSKGGEACSEQLWKGGGLDPAVSALVLQTGPCVLERWSLCECNLSLTSNCPCQKGDLHYLRVPHSGTPSNPGAMMKVKQEAQTKASPL